MYTWLYQRHGRWLNLLCGFWFGLFVVYSNSYTSKFVPTREYFTAKPSTECLTLVKLAESFLHRNESYRALSRTVAANDSDVRKNEYLSLMLKDDHFHESDSTVIADNLAKTVKVHCSVYVFNRRQKVRARSIMETWGKRCNKLVFFSVKSDNTIPTIGLGAIINRAVMFKAFNYIYEHDMSDFDWFIGTAYDTYVIMENLRHFLSNENSSETIYFGYHNKIRFAFSGGSSIVLSRAALEMYGYEAFMGDTAACRKILTDRQFMLCLKEVNVIDGNTLDALGRRRFYSFDPGTFLSRQIRYSSASNNSRDKTYGPDSLSDYSIAFHNLGKMDLYMFEWHVYHLRLYGIKFGLQDLNQRNKNSIFDTF